MKTTTKKAPKKAPKSQPSQPYQPSLPITEADWLTYRARLHCNLGLEVIERKIKPPPGISPTDYAVYVMLSAIACIAQRLDHPPKPQP
jgi:hypothetical protein